MAKRWITCPKCAGSWQMGYWKWVLKAPMHFFNFIRYTKCPYCRKWSWVHREK